MASKAGIRRNPANTRRGRQTSANRAESFARSPSLRAGLAFRRQYLPIRSILLTLAGTLNSFRRKFSRNPRGRANWVVEAPFGRTLKPPPPPLSTQKARKSLARVRSSRRNHRAILPLSSGISLISSDHAHSELAFPRGRSTRVCTLAINLSS